MTGATSDLIVSVTDLDGVQYVVLSGEMDLATAEGLGDALNEILGSTVLLDMQMYASWTRRGSPN